MKDNFEIAVLTLVELVIKKGLITREELAEAFEVNREQCADKR